MTFFFSYMWKGEQYVRVHAESACQSRKSPKSDVIISGFNLLPMTQMDAFSSSRHSFEGEFVFEPQMANIHPDTSREFFCCDVAHDQCVGIVEGGVGTAS